MGKRRDEFPGSRKSTPFAAQQTAEACAKKAMEQGMRRVEVRVKGPDPEENPQSALFQPRDLKLH